MQCDVSEQFMLPLQRCLLFNSNAMQADMHVCVSVCLCALIASQLLQNELDGVKLEKSKAHIRNMEVGRPALGVLCIQAQQLIVFVCVC